MGCNNIKAVSTTISNNSSVISPSVSNLPMDTTHITKVELSRTSQNPTTEINGKYVNFESHQLVLLDANVNGNESSIVIESLRSVLGYVQVFDNIEKCYQYLQDSDGSITTFLITSGQLGEIFVPKIHDLPSVLKIYVYCRNEKHHQQWASKYEKVNDP